MTEKYLPCPVRRGRFVNPHLEEERRSLWHFLLWRFGRYDDPIVTEPPPDLFVYPSMTKSYDRDKPSAVWVGHSTYLIDNGQWIYLTDPVWGRYCSPVPLRGLQRKKAPPFPIEGLPKLNAVLVSHNHYDHLDARAVKEIQWRQPGLLWVVPKGLAKWFRKRGIEAEELGWWESLERDNERITAVPAQHFSGRGLFDKNKTLWNGYVVEGKKTFYFVGDTGYNPFQFKEIGQRFKIDLSLIPIGTYVPKAFMAPVHCSPYEAVEIHRDVNSKFSLGMHWNTFRLSDEPLDRPPYDLYLAMKAKNLLFDTFLPIDIGVHVNW